MPKLCFLFVMRSVNSFAMSMVESLSVLSLCMFKTVRLLNRSWFILERSHQKKNPWENSRCPKFTPKKMSKVLICAWHPMILPRMSDWSFSSREIVHSWRRAAKLSRIRWKQRARTIHLVEQRPSIPLALDSGPSRFSFISPGDFLVLVKTLWGKRFLLLCP